MHHKVKVAVFWFVTFFVTWLGVEAISFVACRLLNGTYFSFRTAREQLDASLPTSSSDLRVAGLSDLRWNDYVEVLHPYFGFVAEPHQNKPQWKVSDFGFVLSDRANPIVKRSSGKVIIGIFGGSFTNWVYLSLKAAVERDAAALGKEFVVLNFSAAGYKQPQQLMILNYLLALGAEFDIVINLDGFNEVALPPSENIPSQVNPFYPRGWDRRTANTISPTTVRLIGYVEVTRERKEHWARAFQRHHLYFSPTLFLAWKLRDQALARAIYDANLRLKVNGADPQSYAMRGPSYTYHDEAELYRDLVDVWKRSSLQMKALSVANGARYYHFLQPNQYVEGSKPMTAPEKRQAVNEESPYKHAVAKGYPFLVEAGAELQKAGVNFTDLTMIYAGNDRVLYLDDCCHTNSEGSDIVAQRILESIELKK